MDTIEINSEPLRSEQFLNYKQVLSDESMLLIGKVLGIFHDEWGDFVLGKIRYFAVENELHISLESGTKILITFQNDISGNLTENLNFIKKQLVTLRSYIAAHKKELLGGGIIYIDARIDSKLFICWDKDVCKQNLMMIYGQIYAE